MQSLLAAPPHPLTGPSSSCKMWGRTDSCRRLGPWLSHGCAQLGGFRCLWGEGDPSQEFQKLGRQPLLPSVHLALLGFTPTSTPKRRVLTQCGSPLGAHPHPTAAKGAGPSLRRATPPQATAGPGRDSRLLPSSGCRGHRRAGTRRAWHPTPRGLCSVLWGGTRRPWGDSPAGAAFLAPTLTTWSGPGTRRSSRAARRSRSEGGGHGR